MNADQYQGLLQRRRRPRALRLDEAAPAVKAGAGRVVRSPVAAIIRRAAEQLRRREAAAAAWARLVPAGCRAGATVAGVQGNVVIVEVTDASVHYELRRHHAALERELSRLVPGVQRLHLAVLGPD